MGREQILTEIFSVLLSKGELHECPESSERYCMWLIQNSNLELLRAAQKYLKTLKHLTFTGSVVTVQSPMEPYDGKVLTSKDWNAVCYPMADAATWKNGCRKAAPMADQ